MALLRQSVAYNKMILMVASSNHISGLASATLTITVSKNGGAFASITPTVTDRGNGWYCLELTTSHTDTLGELAYHITATDADPTDEKDQVIATDLTVANIPANVTQIDGVANSTHASGMFPADVRDISGSAVSATTAQLGVNVVNWNNAVVATPNTAGVPLVDDRVNSLRVGTAQAVAAGSITLDAGASATDAYYVGMKVSILSATTGDDQSRIITGYTGSSKVATISPNWTTTPTGTIVFALSAQARVDVGYVAGTAQTPRDLGGQLDAAVSTRMATFTLPTNFSSLAITAGGAVTAGTVSDKTGYSLTQTFPTNFSALSISAGGVVSANITQIDGAANGTHAAGYIPADLRQVSGAALSTTAAQIGVNVVNVGGTAQTARDLGGQLDVAVSTRMATFTLPPNFSALAITVGGAVTVGTNNDKTGYSLTQAFPTNFGSLSITAGGVVQASLRDILGSAVSGTAAQVAGSFSSFFDVATPTGTINSLPAAVPGASNGLQICGTNAAASYSGLGITATFTGNLTGSVASVSGAVGSVTGDVGGNVTGSVGSVVARVTANTDQIEGADATNQIKTAVFDGVVENSTTLVQFIRGFAAVLLGKASGMATTSVTFRDTGDTKDRVVATTDSSGDRSDITLDLT